MNKRRPIRTTFWTVSATLSALAVGVFVMMLLVAVFQTVVGVTLPRSSSQVQTPIVKYTASEPATMPTSVISSITTSKPVISTAKKQPITAESYIIMNLVTDKVVEAKNADKVLPIASITKLFTATIAAESLKKEQTVTITSDILKTEGATGKFKKGEKITVGNLMYPLLMVSSNDAAEAIAKAYGRKDFISALNRFVAALGTKITHFDDPSGLSPKNVSSARELAEFVDWMYVNHPEILDITNLKSKAVRGHVWTNTTHFLNIAEYRGGKIGFTDEADRTAVSVFMIPNAQGIEEPHVIVILHSQNRDADVKALLTYSTTR